MTNDVRFNIYTGLLKAAPMGEDGIKRLKTTASSTIKDLSGDEMELSALQRMAATAQQNMTIFLNHKYQVPEDVLGSVEKAEIHTRDAGMFDLDFDIRVDESNERAVKTWNQIMNGTKLGCSIGAKIPEGGYEVTKDGLKIKDVYLLEASIVGIPANPRSFVQYATKALHDAESEEEAESTPGAVINLNLGAGADAQTFTVGEGSSETINVLSKAAESEEDKEPVPPDAKKDPVDVADGGESGIEQTTTESDVTSGPSDKEDKAEGDSSQELDKSLPDSDGIEDEDTRAVLAKGIETFEVLLRSANDQLVEARKALAGETEQRAKAERERDEVKADLKLARNIVERISALPIGRRTSFKAAASDFRSKFSGVYDDEVLKLLERDSNGTE